MELNLANFFEYSHLDIKMIYAKGSFSHLCVLARAKENFDEELENVLTKAFGWICAINSRRWIQCLLNVLPKIEEYKEDYLSVLEKRMLQMFFFPSSFFEGIIQDSLH